MAARCSIGDNALPRTESGVELSASGLRVKRQGNRGRAWALVEDGMLYGGMRTVVVGAMVGGTIGTVW